MFRSLMALAMAGYAQFMNPVNQSIFLVGDTNQTYIGTAFALQTSKGIFTVTNAHICKQEPIMIAIIDKLPVLLVVKKVYTKQDLCLLSAPYGVKPLNLAKFYSYLGETTSVDGYPEGVRSLSTGDTSGYYSTSTGMYIRYAGKVTFGNSGSPVVNKKGEVVGVISLVDSLYGQFGEFVPLEYIQDLVDSMP